MLVRRQGGPTYRFKIADAAQYLSEELLDEQVGPSLVHGPRLGRTTASVSQELRLGRVTASVSQELRLGRVTASISQEPRLGRVTDVGTVYDERQRFALIYAARMHARTHA